MDDDMNTHTTEQIIPPTCAEIWNEAGFTRVERNVDDSWRHGSNREDIIKRESDGTFWSVNYRVSTDGETHGLRDGEAEIMRVYPRQVTTTAYSTEP